MNFVDNLEGLDEKAKLNLAMTYACHIYNIDRSTLHVPNQGEQTFTFLTEDRAIRLPRSDGVTALMKDEVDVLRSLQGKTNLQTATVLDFQPDKSIMSVSRISGKELSKEKFAGFPIEQQVDIASRLGRFLAEMHNLLPQTQIIEEPWWKPSTLEKIDTLIDKTTDPQQIKRLQDAALYTREYGSVPDHYVTLHGDAHLGNLMFDPRTNSLGIIDFTSVKLGSAHRDFVKLRRNLPEQAYEAAIGAYESVSSTKIDRAKVDIALDIFEIHYSSGVLSPRIASPSMKATDNGNNTKAKTNSPSFKSAKAFTP